MTSDDVVGGGAPAGRRFPRVGFAVLTALGLALSIAVPLTLDVGTAGASGPGMWVLGAAVLTTVLSLIATLHPRILLDAAETPTRAQMRDVALALPALLLAVPSLLVLGVGITTAWITFYWLRFVTGTSWLRSAIAAAAITAGILLIFLVALDVPFPRGSLTRL
ncbi:hypothetical protein GCM10009846_00310 [Agrococcus versicolor]|uniref:DUF1468 domain-containing protein n=1 Tax=Agrococcus versicolor TaxID=501482 RepID=A0ABN3AIB2_9MICO